MFKRPMTTVFKIKLKDLIILTFITQLLLAINQTFLTTLYFLLVYMYLF